MTTSTAAPRPFSFLAWADQDLVLAARDVAADIPAALSLAIDLSPLSSHLGTSTWSYLQSLGSLGAGDLTVARVVEPHLDALSILAQAADAHPGADGGDVTVSAPPGSTWGVYAAHSPDTHLDATRSDAGWRLSGSKPWCSLAAHVSHAIITAHVSDERRQAFAVDLSHPGIRRDDASWASRGLVDVRSTGLDLHDVPATPVGPAGWYLTRPGFAWGGVAVAAVWFGAAAALAQRVLDAACRREPDQIATWHLGRLDRALRSAELELRAAAAAIDAGTATGAAGAFMAARARDAAASAAHVCLTEVARALGPAPLTFDEEHARRVADLTVYVRQHHGDRDLARTGALLVEAAR